MTDREDTTDAGLHLCRDCLREHDRGGGRCPDCGSPRLLTHPELADLAIAHIDCDAFYAAIEKRDDPGLAEKPVIIGGGRRGVVSTACYIARTFGVHSAMPMFKALKACPDAVVVRPNMEKYATVGRQLRVMMRDLTPAVEPLSIDEAFLDLSGTDRLHHATPARVLAGFAQTVEREVGISISIGLSHNKFLAKIASDLDKPRGFSVIGRAETRSFLAEQPVGLIWGVGKAMRARLARDGITRIGQLQTMAEKTLATRYGSIGLRLSLLSRGEDTRAVIAGRGAKSVSSETTFFEDLSAPADLLPILRKLSEKVAARLKAKDLAGNTVVLKLKTANFRTRTRNAKLADPTHLADRIFRTGRDLLKREIDGTRFRLIGIGVSDLTEGWRADPDDLLDPEAAKRARAEAAMDAIRARFGRDGVEVGLTFAPAEDDKR
jgi:DNA polymerase-4